MIPLIISVYMSESWWWELIKLIPSVLPIIIAIAGWLYMRNQRRKQCGVDVQVYFYSILLEKYSCLSYTLDNEINMDDPSTYELCFQLISDLRGKIYLLPMDIINKVKDLPVDPIIGGNTKWKYKDPITNSESKACKILVEIRTLLLKELYINY